MALQIGHHISVDFDLFSTKPIAGDLLASAEKIFNKNNIQTLVNNKEELTLLIDSIKVTFLYYPFPLLNALLEYQGLYLLDIKELAATKAYTIGRRGSLKDYVDLYFVLKLQKTSLGEITSLAEKKYNQAFNSWLFLEQLVYLEDISDTKIKFLKEAVTKEQLEIFFADKIKEFGLT